MIKKIVIICMMVLSAILFSSNKTEHNFIFSRIKSDTGTVILQTGDYNIDKVNIGGQTFSRIDHGSGVVTNEKGYSELPYFSTAIQLLNDSNIDMTVSAYEFEDIQLDHPVIPSRGVFTRSCDHKSIPYKIFEESITDEFYPAEITDSYGPFIFRDTRGVNVVFYPFRYNPVKRILRVYTMMEVTLSENSETPLNPLYDHDRTVAREADAMYRPLYLNYNETKSLKVGDKGDILVIYTTENGGLEALSPYIEWKTKLGHKVHTLEVPNGTDLHTQNTIKDAYIDNKDILFVQLVGGWNNLKSQFRTFSSLGSGPTDPTLGFVAGDDKYQDIIIGRFSVNSEAQLANQIWKGINYEKNPDLDGEWYTKAIALASDEGEGYGDDGESDELHNDIIIDYKLLPSSYTEGYRVYQRLGGSSSQISSYVNSGASLINFTGHGYTQGWGGPNYSNSHVNNLTNGSRLPYIVSVSCVSGLFSGSSDCFAEAWMKKENGGSVAGWFSTINQPWLPPMRGQDYFADILVGGYDYSTNPGHGISTSEQRYTYGSITLNSAVLMLSEAPTDNSTIATIETWTVFGDGALQVRRDRPIPIENMIETVFLNSYSTRVTSSGEPVEGLTVSLYRDGTAYHGITDGNGEVEIEHSFTPGEVTVTISGFNIATYSQETAVIAPEGPYLVVREYEFSTNEFGETSTLDLSIANVGLDETSGVEFFVSTDSEYITINTAGYSFDPDIVAVPGGSSLVSSGVISLTISGNIPDRERVRFTVAVMDSEDNEGYFSNIYLTARSPRVEVSHDIASPTSIQGTSQEVVFAIENKGSTGFGSFTAELVQTTDHEIIMSEPVELGSLLPGDKIDISFTCFYGEDIPNSSNAEFELRLISSRGLTEKYSYSRVIGMTENFSSGDFSKNDWVFSGDTNWVIDDEIYFEAGYSASSGTVGHNQKATLSISFDYYQNGTISFYKKVSSELNYDKLNFYINGVLKGSWSGNRDWARFEYEVDEGLNEFVWTFERDPSHGWGMDRAWIDNILAAGINTTGIDNDSYAAVPDRMVLHQNYPNPFNPVTTIRYSLDRTAEVRLSIYNISGQKVSDLVSGIRNAGHHKIDFDAGRLNSGIYYYTLEVDGKAETKKMLLIK